MAKSIRSKVKKRFRTVKREKLRSAVAENLKDLHEKALAAPRQEIGPHDAGEQEADGDAAMAVEEPVRGRRRSTRKGHADMDVDTPTAAQLTAAARGLNTRNTASSAVDALASGPLVISGAIKKKTMSKKEMQRKRRSGKWKKF